MLSICYVVVTVYIATVTVETPWSSSASRVCMEHGLHNLCLCWNYVSSFVVTHKKIPQQSFRVNGVALA